MKNLFLVLVISMGVFVTTALAQAPQGAGPRGPVGPGGGPAAGGRGGGALRGGGRGTPEPPASGPIADMVSKFVEAVNKQDASALQKLVTADAVLVDEDGHFDPISLWIRFLTTTGPKTLTVLGGRGLSPLKVSEMGDTAWAAFNYNLKETVTPRGQTTSTPNEINGTVTMAFKKNGGDWQAYLVHIAVMGKAFNPPPR
ncbi:MAG TPA: nuclear transport factor 2 family protein [Terriglobia bacterium]|nr:nuclear transport factor 2 family protein [Terriglobia bacterium]